MKTRKFFTAQEIKKVIYKELENSKKYEIDKKTVLNILKDLSRTTIIKYKKYIIHYIKPDTGTLK